MECNKEEAVRAKQLAEKKFLERDYTAARRFVEKAQRLYPGLEGLAQFSAVADVHYVSHIKLHGVETDWYGILQVDPKADDALIKKQYRKLALLLHPDKNKSVGSESAFKLVGEAWSVLSDSVKRLHHNQRRNAPPPNNARAMHTGGRGNAQAAQRQTAAGKAANSNWYQAQTQPPLQNRGAFQTGAGAAGGRMQVEPGSRTGECPHCRVLYQFPNSPYSVDYTCLRCHTLFRVTGSTHPSAPKPNQVPPPMPHNMHRGPPFQNIPPPTTSTAQEQQAQQHLPPRSHPPLHQQQPQPPHQQNGVHMANGVPKPTAAAEKTSAAGEGPNFRAAGMVNDAWQKVRKQKADDKAAEKARQEERKRQAKAAREEKKRQEAESRAQKRKAAAEVRRGKKVKTFHADDDDDEEEEDDDEEEEAEVDLSSEDEEEVPAFQTDDGEQNLRRSHRRRKEVNYKLYDDEEDEEDEEDILPPVPGQRGKASAKSHSAAPPASSAFAREDGAECSTRMGGRSEAARGSMDSAEAKVKVSFQGSQHIPTGSTPSSSLPNGQPRSEHRNGSSHTARGPTDPRQNQKHKSVQEVFEASPSVKSRAKEDDREKECRAENDKTVMPDPDFSNFDKDREEQNFDKNQIWALYDQEDQMPRYYALVIRVTTSPFKVVLKWLEKDKPELLDEERPVPLGSFSAANQNTIKETEMFSHMVMKTTKSRNIKIWPSQGQVWALYKETEEEWQERKAKSDSPLHTYELVQVEGIQEASKTSEGEIWVKDLMKVAGFKTVFRPTAEMRRMPAKEAWKIFSHQVPAKTLTGEEDPAVAFGDLDLDPGSTPADLMLPGGQEEGGQAS